MNNCFITLQMLGISLATFSQLSCATPEEQSGIGKKISTLSAPAISAEERKNIINRFSQGLEEDDCKYYKEKVISAVEKIYAEHLVEFEAAVDRFSQGMYPYQKVCVIEAIAKIPAERLTPALEVAVSRLSQGMQGQMKA